MSSDGEAWKKTAVAGFFRRHEVAFRRGLINKIFVIFKTYKRNEYAQKIERRLIKMLFVSFFYERKGGFMKTKDYIYAVARQAYKNLSQEEKEKVLNSSVFSGSDSEKDEVLHFTEFYEYIQSTLCSNFEYDFGFPLLKRNEKESV